MTRPTDWARVFLLLAAITASGYVMIWLLGKVFG